MSRCVIKAVTVSLSPFRTFHTPDGKPASYQSFEINNADAGTFSDGFRIIAFPTATAIVLIASGTIAGKLNGEIHVTTPRGCFMEYELMSPPTLTECSPLSS